MTARDWTSLLFRICGIVLILIALVLLLPPTIAQLLTAWMNHELSSVDPGTWLLLLSSIVPAPFLGWMMLRNTDWFVDKAFQSVLRGYDVVASEKTSDEATPIGQPPAQEVSAETSTDDAEDEWVLDLPSLHRDDVLAIGMSLMGVWILSSAVPELLALTSRFFFEKPPNYDSPLTMLELFVSGRMSFSNPPLYVFARVALGLWLFLSSYNIVTVWSKRQPRWKSAQVESGEDDSV